MFMKMSFTKYALLLIAAATLVTVACKKKSTPTHCYVCTQYDSIQTIRGWVSHFNGVSDTQCQKNDGLIAFYVKTHVQYDTFYRQTDSQAVGYHYFRCELSY
jgi:hypothetical protein